jgi:hypothetical protein
VVQQEQNSDTSEGMPVQGVVAVREFSRRVSQHVL